jgi:hypothetical protein
MTELVGKLNLVSGLLMMGVMLVIHFVHYPSFRFYSEESFKEFHPFHAISITRIVMPLMLLEIFCVSYLIFFESNLFNSISFLLILAVWCITFFSSVPAHNKLSAGFSENAFRDLMKGDLVRLILWFFKNLIVVFLIIFQKAF